MFYERFNINPNKKELIALVGGGGKTTTMFKLAKELKALNKKVLVTTSTAIFYPEKKDFDDIIISNLSNIDVFKNIGSGSVTVLCGEFLREDKLLGVSKEFIDEIYTREIFDYILVEADGSRRKPIKAPASHEPVIPGCSTRAIGVIGLDSLGKRIDDEFVHRPEIFREITKSSINEYVDEKKVAKLIVHEHGLFKSVPKGCEKYLLLNKAETQELKSSAFDIMREVIESGYGIDGLVAGSVVNDKYIKTPNEGGVTAVIMASGLSRRMKREKLILPVEGIPVVERVIKAVCSSKVSEVMLIYRNQQVKEIAQRYSINTVYNENAEIGQSEAVKLGVKSSKENSKGYMFFVGDQPFLDNKSIDKLINTFEKGSYQIVVPAYKGKRGGPVIFSYMLKNELLNLEGDRGGKVIIEKMAKAVKFIPIESEKMGMDMDTFEDYLGLRDGGGIHDK